MESTMIEKEHEQKPNVTILEPMGYGIPDATISHEKMTKSGELRPEVDTAAQEYLKSGEGLIAVHEHDDGCIDGRCTEQVYTSAGELKQSDSSNHERAKVSGGGYITGQAIRLGVGVRGESIDSDLAAIGTDFAEKDIVCGAHSGGQLSGEGTGCGANDKFRAILENATVYKDNLRETTEGLLGLIGAEFNEASFNTVIDNWATVASDDSYFAESTGKTRLNTVLATQAALAETAKGEKPPAVTKHLKGDHNEAYIVVNFVEGKTLSQNALLEVLRKEFPGVPDEELPQAFVVDGWRVAELANAAVQDDKKEAALYAGVVFQLATAATLTDGSLKVFAYTE